MDVSLVEGDSQQWIVRNTDTPVSVDPRENGNRERKPSTLNFVEKHQIDIILKEICGTKKSVYQLNLTVENPAVFRSKTIELDTLLAFNFGYAVIIDGRLIIFRVQDHLRKLDLGRRGLSALYGSYKEMGNKLFKFDCFRSKDSGGTNAAHL